MVNKLKNNWNIKLLEETLKEIIASFDISPDYKLISQIDIDSLMKEWTIPIHWTCISITLLLAKKLFDKWINSSVIVTRSIKWNFHCYLKVWEYIVKWFKIEYWLWSERKIFEADYKWGNSLYEVFKNDKVAIFSFKIADTANALLPCSWDIEKIKESRKKRALAMKRILSTKN